MASQAFLPRNALAPTIVLSGLLLLCHPLWAAGTLPSWVAEPPADTAEALIGVGEGASLQQAIRNGLETVAGRLVTSIASEMVMATSVINDQVQHRVDSHLRAEIGHTLVSGYVLEASEKYGRAYFVKLRVDRQSLIGANTQALATVLAELEQYLAADTVVSVMDVFARQTLLEQQLNEAEQKMLVVRALTGGVGLASLQAKVQGFRQVLTNTLNGLVVYIEASSDLQPLARRLVEQLSQEGVRATTDKPLAKSPRVVLKGSFNRTLRFEQNYVIANAQVDVFDEFSNPLSSRQLTIDGQAYLSPEHAITVAINRAIQQLSIDGVAQSLGLLRD